MNEPRLQTVKLDNDRILSNSLFIDHIIIRRCTVQTVESVVK